LQRRKVVGQKGRTAALLSGHFGVEERKTFEESLWSRKCPKNLTSPSLV
jgi:hypothetical protein